jgi:aminoacyl-tRNA hydrolase
MHAAIMPIYTTLGGIYWRQRIRAVIRSAPLRRRFLPGVTFIGVTGSAGKTTTKELIVATLSRRYRGMGSYITENRPFDIARTIWRTRRTHDFCVIEFAAHKPKVIDGPLALVRPRVGIVTTIGDDHLSAYGSREAIAREKGKLIAALPADGFAVLNADDELVAAMRSRCAGTVVTYGVSPGADVRAEDVTATWPGRLEFTVSAKGERLRLRTQLCGAHWTSSVLATVATALGLGLTLGECVDAIAAVAPFLARMEPVNDADGVTFIRDDWKAPLWTTDASFAFMREAHARRKVIVVGTLSDYRGDASAQYARLAEHALAIADHVVFVGPWASRVLRARSRGGAGELRAFSTVHQASGYLNRLLEAGDLVLLKGTNRVDHLERIILARTRTVQCWRDDCRLESFCAGCRNLGVRSSVPSSRADADSEPDSGPLPPGATVVIALGNSGARYRGTPHNVGHEVVDRLCERLAGRWISNGEASVARTRYNDADLCLLKLEASMNVSGAELKPLADRLGFGPTHCVLVHDDLDLPLGSVRVRMRGSAGGHRGVASVLDAFQTDAVPRVKIGIGRPQNGKSVTDYVLEPFPESAVPLVEQGCAAAVDRVLALLGSPRPAS